MQRHPALAPPHDARSEQETRHGRTLLGGLLTFVSAFLLVFLALGAALVAMILSSAAGGFGDEYPGMFACRTQACADDSTLGVFASIAFIVYVIVAIRLAYVATTRALKLVTLGSFVFSGILLLFLWDFWNDEVAIANAAGFDLDYGSFAWLLLIPAAPLLLGMGSWLRLSARRGGS